MVRFVTTLPIFSFFFNHHVFIVVVLLPIVEEFQWFVFVAFSTWGKRTVVDDGGGPETRRPSPEGRGKDASGVAGVPRAPGNPPDVCGRGRADADRAGPVVQRAQRRLSGPAAVPETAVAHPRQQQPDHPGAALSAAQLAEIGRA